MDTHPNWVFFEIQWTNKYDLKYQNILTIKKRCQYFDDAKMKTLSRNWVVAIRPQVIFFSSSLVQNVLVHWIEPNTQFRRGVISNHPTPYSISIIMKKYQCIVKRLDCKPICKKVYLVIYLLYKKSAVKAIK